MEPLHYINNELYLNTIRLADVANDYGTPCYVYSRTEIEKNWRAFDSGFLGIPHRICYAVKANSNLAILNVLAQLNSGFDIVSGGELARVLAAGGDPQKIIFSGVGKTSNEIKQALETNIFCFNVESELEIARIQDLAAHQQKVASIALRINPNVDAGTHPYISTGLKENKFGIQLEILPTLVEQIKRAPNLKLIGIACHIGSQLTELSPFLTALDCLITIVNELQKDGIQLQTLNIGGGLGIHYRNENPPEITDYILSICEKVKSHNLEIIVEPGRAIVGNAGILLTTVEYIKHTPHKNFAIVDAGMNDLLRPALYDAWQNIIPLQQSSADSITYDIVGPVCETADFLGKNRVLKIKPNDVLAICGAGAYGFSMTSNYNSRPRPAEVMINGEQTHLIRQRESIQDLFSQEKIIK